MDGHRMTIGEFATAAGLTPKALRLYDELGLLRPAQVDPTTGYRPLGTGEPDVHLRTARSGDRYLLCTDGVSAVLDDAVLAELLGRGGPAAGASDNAACAVLDLVDG